ncbi:MAG: WYL domain-containing protein [Pseudomonadota bacterium]
MKKESKKPLSKRERSVKLLTYIEKSLDGKEIFALKLENRRPLIVYPHRLAYIDGKLTLIAEDCTNRTLNYYNASEITYWKKKANSRYSPNFNTKAVDHFMAQIRAVNGNEVRLVLKVMAGTQQDLNNGHHYFRRPYVASNPQGDLIWGAWVEISPEFFDWLYKIRTKINILDPLSLRKAFERYCQRRSKEVMPQNPLKKAS